VLGGGARQAGRIGPGELAHARQVQPHNFAKKSPPALVGQKRASVLMSFAR
jgi:hypothetical protein